MALDYAVKRCAVTDCTDAVVTGLAVDQVAQRVGRGSGESAPGGAPAPRRPATDSA